MRGAWDRKTWPLGRTGIPTRTTPAFPAALSRDAHTGCTRLAATSCIGAVVRGIVRIRSARLMDRETRRRLYAACEDEPLDPDDERNIDVDSTMPRGIRWARRLATRIDLASQPVSLFFTGLPGSGKSTELRRLTASLSSGQGPRLLVVLIDSEQVLDLTQPLDVPDLITIACERTEAAVLKAEGNRPEAALQDGYLTRLWSWLCQTDVSFKEANLQVKNVAELVVELKTRPTLRERFRATIAGHLTTFLREAGQHLEALEQRALAVGYSGLCIIFDSLEKLRGTGSSWSDVLLSAERVFGTGAPYLRLPVHTLYTVPAALVSRQVGEIEFMPMVKVRDRDGRLCDTGWYALRELIRRRLPDAVLDELLGSEQREARVSRVIERSGGYPREIVHVLRMLLELDELPASRQDLNRIENEIRDRLRAVITEQDAPWLARVARHKDLVIPDEQHRPSVDRALSNNLVFRYCNEDAWYDLHPAVRDIPVIRDALDLEPAST
jgi:hypothetical protein